MTAATLLSLIYDLAESSDFGQVPIESVLQASGMSRRDFIAAIQRFAKDHLLDEDVPDGMIALSTRGEAAVTGEVE